LDVTHLSSRVRSPLSVLGYASRTSLRNAGQTVERVFAPLPAIHSPFSLFAGHDATVNGLHLHNRSYPHHTCVLRPVPFIGIIHFLTPTHEGTILFMLNTRRFHFKLWQNRPSPYEAAPNLGISRVQASQHNRGKALSSSHPSLSLTVGRPLIRRQQGRS